MNRKRRLLSWSAAMLAIAIPGGLATRATGSADANPHANDKNAIAAGRKLFLHHCSACHGDNAEGTPRAPSLVTETVARTSPEKLERLLRNGSMRRGMPSWSGLPEQRRRQIVAYLESLHDR